MSGVVSVTIPVKGGDRVRANSFAGGSRATWFLSNEPASELQGTALTDEYNKDGNQYITAPANAVALSVSMSPGNPENGIYILTLPDDSANDNQYEDHVQQLPDPAYKTTNLWNMLTPEGTCHDGSNWVDGTYSVTIPVTGGDQISASSFGLR